MNFIPKYEKEYEKMQGLLDMYNIAFEDALWLTKPNCEDLFNTCLWKERLWRCDSLFEETLTSLGICCSFNYYGFKNTTFSGYCKDFGFFLVSIKFICLADIYTSSQLVVVQ